METSDARAAAYRYILERLSRLPADSGGADSTIWIPLDGLRLLKDGLADPSPELVASLCALLGDETAPGEIHQHLVAPFVKSRRADAGEERSNAQT